MAAADHMWPTSLGPRHGSVRDALRCSFSGRHPMLWPVNRLSWATAGSCKTTSRRHLSRSMNSPFALRPIPEYRCHPHLLTRRRQAFGQTQEISHGQEFKVHRLSPSYAADSSPWALPWSDWRCLSQPQTQGRPARPHRSHESLPSIGSPPARTAITGAPVMPSIKGYGLHRLRIRSWRCPRRTRPIRNAIFPNIKNAGTRSNAEKARWERKPRIAHLERSH